MFICKTSKFSYVLSQVSYLYTNLLFYPHLLLTVVSPCLFFPRIPSLSCLSLYFALLLYSMHPCISPSPCFSWLWDLFTTLFAVGSYATTTSSGVSGMMLVHHLLIYFLRSRHIPSFSVVFLLEGCGPAPLPARAWLAARTKRSPASGLRGLWSGSPGIQAHLHLLKSSAISLFLSTTPRQTSCQQILISLGTQGICSYGKHFFRVL